MRSMGASLALAYAASDADIQGVVMLSPGLDYKGLDTVALVQAFALVIAAGLRVFGVEPVEEMRA